jgi:hypothetical protein
MLGGPKTLERPLKLKRLPARIDTLLDKNLLLSILPLIHPSEKPVVFRACFAAGLVLS